MEHLSDTSGRASTILKAIQAFRVEPRHFKSPAVLSDGLPYDKSKDNLPKSHISSETTLVTSNASIASSWKPIYELPAVKFHVERGKLVVDEQQLYEEWHGKRHWVTTISCPSEDAESPESTRSRKINAQGNVRTQHFLDNVLAIPYDQDEISLDVARIKASAMTMPLRPFLSWLSVTYNMQRFLPKNRQSRTILRFSQLSRPSTSYHELLSLEVQYSVDEESVSNKTIYQVIRTIYNTLRWLRNTIDHNLEEIENHYKSKALRDFIAWAYQHYNVKLPRKFFVFPGPRNPHHIYSTNRAREEAITYYMRSEFSNDGSAQCLYAMHIVFLLGGGRDWRVTAGDRLISCHPTPGQVGTV